MSTSIATNKQPEVRRVVPRSAAAGPLEPSATAKHTITSEDELQRLVRRHTGTVITMCGPDLATWLLKLNSGNRPLSKGRAERFRRVIEQGLWINTGEPVIVSREGVLNDGQNRLTGIKAGTKSVELDIRFGIPREAFITTGTGATRKASDMLHIMGIGSGSVTTVASSARLLLMYDLGLPESFGIKITAQEVVKAASERWPDLADAVGLAFRHLNTGGSSAKLMSGAAGAWTFLALKQANSAQVEAFLEVVGQGTTPNRFDPPRLLRERLLKGDILRGQSTEKLALFIKAWNYSVAGERVTNIRWRSRGDQAEGFPTIEGIKL